MTKNKIEDIIDFIFMKIMCFPVYITENSKFKIIRIIGILLMFVWILFASPILIVIIFLMLLEIFIKL